MGSVTNSILSGTSGRTGRVVIANIHGVEVSRARPVMRSSSTEPQTAHRELFRFAAAFLGLYKSFARLFFGKRKGLVTPYNQAQANVLENIQLAGDEVIINYSQVLISKGNLLEMIPESISSSFVYMPSRRDGQFFSGVAARQAGSATVNMLPFYAGEEVHVWATFTDEAATAACNSRYMGFTNSFLSHIRFRSTMRSYEEQRSDRLSLLYFFPVTRRRNMLDLFKKFMKICRCVIPAFITDRGYRILFVMQKLAGIPDPQLIQKARKGFIGPAFKKTAK